MLLDCPGCGYPSKGHYKGIYTPGRRCPGCGYVDPDVQTTCSFCGYPFNSIVMRMLYKFGAYRPIQAGGICPNCERRVDPIPQEHIVELARAKMGTPRGRQLLSRYAASYLRDRRQGGEKHAPFIMQIIEELLRTYGEVECEQ